MGRMIYNSSGLTREHNAWRGEMNALIESAGHKAPYRVRTEEERIDECRQEFSSEIYGLIKEFVNGNKIDLDLVLQWLDHQAYAQKYMWNSKQLNNL
jgi:hypothetical protein